MIKNFQELIAQAKEGSRRKVAVVCAHDKEVLLSLKRAVREEIAQPILVGKEEEISSLLKELDLDLGAEIINADTDAEAAELAVKKVSCGDANMLMKGLVATPTFLKAVLNKEWGLRKAPLLSHIGFFKVARYDRIFHLTDGGMNMYPDIHQKKLIVENAVEIAHKLGNECPKIACVAALELVNPAMQTTIDAAMLSKMQQRGQIKGCLIDGPLGLDNAVSEESAKHKGIKSEVAGKADILLTSDIDSGNAIYKTIAFFTEMESAGIIAGAAVPIILTSRADTPETKFHSIAVASAISQR
jgi:phosphate butyryltransferase